MPDLSPNLFSTETPAVSQAPSPPILHEFGDIEGTRQAIYDKVLSAASGLPPVQNPRYSLRLDNLSYIDPDVYSKKDQKQAILSGNTLGRRLRGTWTLTDVMTGEPVDQRQQIVATVPFLTHRGTYIHNGNEYTLRNQQRLRAGVYARQKENGELEAHANVLPGKGISHRYHIDPAKGVFYLDVQQAKLPLLPLLTAMGATSRQIRDAWGDELYAANLEKDEGAALKKLAAKLLKPGDLAGDEVNTRQKLVEKFQAMELDPEVSRRTLSRPASRLDLDTILDVTKKLLAISKGDSDVDDRDALPYQTFMGPEDLFAERIAKDSGGTRRNLLFKATNKGDLSGMPSSALRSQLESALLGSGLGQPLEEINPAEIYDKLYAVSRLGEGGIPSVDAVPEEARAVQPSHMGYIDALRTPESFRTGVDLYMSRSSRKGSDGKVYTQFKDPRTGQLVWKNPQEIADTAVTFPRVLQKYSGYKKVPAIQNGRMTWVKKRDIGLVLPNFENAFSPLANLVPLKNMVKGQRVAMATRMLTQALPLADGETPLVQNAVPGTFGKRSFDEEYSAHMGAIFAKQPGQVLDVTPDAIKVRYADGKQDEIELYNNFPFNRKTFTHQTATVRPGDSFTANSLLAKSNYTDKTGSTALGKNLRTAYLSWQGKNFEDAVVISEGAAKKLASEHMYQHGLEIDNKTKLGKKTYMGLFPGKFNREALARLDDRGVVKVGTPVAYGDPLVLAVKERESAETKVHRRKQAGHMDATITWDHHDPGVVTDVVDGKYGPVVVVKSYSEMQVGDKLSGRYGDKGVVADVIPDHQMPHDREGKPFEILLSPLGVVTRTNPAQKIESQLGKLAVKLGHPIKLDDFDDTKDMSAWAYEQLRKNGLDDLEDIIDPTHERKIPQVSTGVRYFMKLQHTSESKAQARGSGGYTAEGTPSKGGETGSKRISLLDTNALLSHGATETLRDATSIRGQRNEQYWLRFMQGFNPATPKIPIPYQKFVHQLQAAGINVIRRGSQTNIMALTDADVDRLAGTREITSGDAVDWRGDLRPLSGGLFDKALTGGHGGTRWAAIKLAEPLPNPVMEEPIRRVLGLTQKQFEGVISGDNNLSAFGSGPAAIAKALDSLDLDRELQTARAKIQLGNKTERDSAIRRLGYLKSAKKLGIHPRDWMLRRVPVIPPAFRPVSLMQGNLPLVSDSNYLYKELFEANRNLAGMKAELGEEGVGPERLATYNAFKAVTGLGDPISQKSQQKGVRGILKTVFGHSPKFGTVQRKLISTTVDNVGRAVITPNPDLDMDSVGLPEEKAFDIYGKFVARRLRRAGMPLTIAMRHIKEQTPLAREMLLEEMEERPVFINRAPVLHKFGIMAFKPRLMKGHTLQVSPLIVKGFNADFDGDAMQFHVPTDEGARKEALERLLPSRSLLSPADFKSPMHMVSNEYVAGLYAATSGKSKRPTRIYRNMAELKQAYARGMVSINDPVRILED